ncbi:contractile injection system tape measure protein [Aequorivita antarctica]|uniref:Uncharacterized protein n=1 Tax=Aequorivita antarctica TaxID=153266 RepID=A0A5C6Z252_9FLAO|nr:contractile injection system tape measure protein [Aequorivita antarctica]TXD73785.1 hypothetical protein ESU54_04755 [Aequorivita antarctica]SRX73502.1 hypothetical protein AEQU3_00942 [Aequorivita antarctica]
MSEQVDREFLDSLLINSAGLIIIAPFLPMLFEKSGLMQDSRFRDAESLYKAIHLLEYAAAGSTIVNEQDLVIHKVLCGISIKTPIDLSITLSDTDKELVESLLLAVIQQWTVLGQTSIAGLQETFLQRKGRLEEDADAYFLRVEQKAFDMLLDQIPWNITTIKLGWMQKTLNVTWR